MSRPPTISRPTARIWGCALLYWLAPATAARAQTVGSLDLEVATGGGNDTNALLQVLPPGTTQAAASGWYGAVAPAAAGSLIWGDKHRHRLSLGYQADLRAADEFGFLLFHQGTLSYLSPGWRGTRGLLSFSGGQFDTGDFPWADFRFLSAGAGLRADLGARWRLAADYAPEWRAGAGVNTGGEVLHLAEGSARYRVSPHFAAGLFVSHLSLGDPRAGLFSSFYRRDRSGLFSAWEFGRFSAVARAHAGLRVLVDTTGPGAAHTQPTMGVTIGVRFQITPSVAIVGLAETAADIGGDRLAGNADRRNFSLMLVFSTAVRRVGGEQPSQTDPRPVTGAGGVRLRFFSPTARRVQLIGSFDDWGAGWPLSPVAASPGLWEVWLPLPPGEYQYHFLVDGTPARPDAAPRYVPDGYGGQDAVLEIPR